VLLNLTQVGFYNLDAGDGSRIQHLGKLERRGDEWVELGNGGIAPGRHEGALPRGIDAYRLEQFGW
jgi:hypothetical protein